MTTRGEIERRTFVLGGIGAAVLGAAACGDETPQDSVSAGDEGAARPDIVVLYLDDMRADGLAFMPKTLARFAHRFGQARANGGACTDTRLGLFSGTYTQNHPWDWRATAREHDAERTWGPWLQAAGYRTGLFGEYITTDVWTAGIEPGWDVWRSYYAEAHHEWGFVVDEGRQPIEPVEPDEGNLAYFTNRLIDFLEDEPSPKFALWAPQHPHTVTDTGALEPLPEHRDKWLDLPSPVPVDEDVADKPEWIRALPPVTADEEADIRRAQREQAQVLSGVDDAVERIFAALESAGRLDSTLVFFSSDQGVHYGEHRWGAALGVPAAVQKGTLYEPVVRVPLLATGPGFDPGETDVPTSQVDITATVLSAADATSSHPVDGLDLRMIAAEPGAYADRSVLLQARVVFTVAQDYDAVVTGPRHPVVPSHKFARLATGETELYDLEVDPGEFVNLADDPEAAEKRRWLEDELNRLLSA